MKKYVSLILAFMLASLSLTGCMQSETIEKEEVSKVTSAVLEETSSEGEVIIEETESEPESKVESEIETESETESKIEEEEEKEEEETESEPEKETESSTSTIVGSHESEDFVENEKEEVVIKEPTEVTYINGILIANKTYGLPSSYAPGDLLGEVYSAFYQLQAAAREDGLNIYISSGYRSYELQKSLYERYCARDGQAAADRYSARPGHSEHQTGLALDVNEISDAFIGTPEAIWLSEHAHEYGFIIRYMQNKEHITGYKYEPWHIRYLGVDLATSVYESGLCLEEYLGIDSVYKD